MTMNHLPLFQVPSLSVSELTQYMRALLDRDEILQNVWVRGEISNLSRPASGHLYFTLKDQSAALRCVIWRSSAGRLRVNMQNGLAIEAHGAISIYERDGQYQLYVDAARPAGEGLLYQEYLRLKALLESEGLFDEERKRPIPTRPLRIGLVTSPTGAALQDMLNTLNRRYPLVEVILAPCAVQGEAAPAEIVRALRALGRMRPGERPDVIVVARGGGSLEDLWAFNDEDVVRAIAVSPAPVITGIGHETDFTLSDFAADLRAPTPTGAAMLSVPDKADLQAELAGLRMQLTGIIQYSLDEHAYALSSVRQRLERASPDRRIRSDRQQVDDLQSRALRALQHTLALHQARRLGLENRLNALNPTAILQRGFALLQREDGSLLRSAAQARPGEALSARLHDGTIDVRVESKPKNNVEEHG
jgi:exodeoxyribonuclease VII large subunit